MESAFLMHSGLKRHTELKTNVFNQSILISTSTEISLRAGVWFPTLSAAVLSWAHASPPKTTTTTTTNKQTNKTTNTHTHTHGERQARTLLLEVVFGTSMCTHRGYQRHWPSLTARRAGTRSCRTFYVWIQHCLLLSLTTHTEEHAHRENWTELIYCVGHWPITSWEGEEVPYNHSVMDTKTRMFFEFAWQVYSSRDEIVHSFTVLPFWTLSSYNHHRQCHSSKVLPNDITNNFQLFLRQSE